MIPLTNEEEDIYEKPKFVTYVTKNLRMMKKIKTTQNLEIMIITTENLEVLLIVYVI